MKKKLISLLLAALLLFAVLPGAAVGDSPETWAVYVYMCGSDLESRGGCATDNIMSLMANTLPENVTFVLETGGALAWRNDTMNPDFLERWAIYKGEDSNLITKLAQLPLASMADPATFEDFLHFARTEYPADHTMVIVWDHGGGTVGGACVDEHFNPQDTLSVSGMAAACANVFGKDENDPPLDIMAYDCCLMATVDVAAAFTGTARYLIASEETIPGDGWDYGALAATFAAYPEIDPESLGTLICNEYLAYYTAAKQAGVVTLSMTDLTKFPALMNAYEEFGTILLGVFCEDPSLYLEVAVNTSNSENYGFNSRATGWVNLVDLYDFAQEYAVEGFEQAQAVCDAIDACVIANVCGTFRQNSHGLSFYFPFNGNIRELNIFDREAAGTAFKTLYSVVTEKELTEEEQLFFKKYEALGVELPPKIKTFMNVDISQGQIRKNDAGRCYVDFGPEVGAATVDAMVELFYIADSGAVYMLGSDDEISCDFDQGRFTDKFSGQWLGINGWLAYINLDYDSPEYNIYSIPVECEGRRFFLQRGYNFEGGYWEDLGARAVSSDPGQARSFFFDPTDTIRIMQKVQDDDTGEFVYIAVDEIPYGEINYSFDPLPAGRFAMRFRLEDVFRTVLYSDYFYFTIQDGTMYFD